MGILGILIAGIVLVGALSGFVAMERKAGGDKVRVEWAEANRAARAAEEKKAQAAATKTEAVRVEIRYRTKTITKEVDKIVDRPVYSATCLDADGLRLARCAIRGQSADTCKPDKPVPASGTVGGREGGIRLAMDYSGLRSLP